ncbi:hypothetical protein T08_10524 [Trichinella sp. T8]|nr:hypothetical protein T08_10524 [Trichinella sp. T8]
MLLGCSITHLNIKICEFCVLESSCFIISVQYSMLHEKPGLDKSIVPYFGNHSAMFMKGTLIRLRYKRKKFFSKISKFRALETWLLLRKLATMAAWRIHYYIENRPITQLDFVATLSSAC